MAKDLCRLIVDRIEAAVLQTVIQPPSGGRWGSLKSLEKVLASKIEPNVARAALTPLAGIYELRLADAHLPSSEYANSFEKAGVDPDQPLVMQGRDLLHAAVDVLYRVCEVVDSEW